MNSLPKRPRAHASSSSSISKIVPVGIVLVFLLVAGSMPLVPFTMVLAGHAQEDAAGEEVKGDAASGAKLAQEALDGLAGRYRDAKTLRSRFAQEVHSLLAIEPLRSSGQFYFRKEPACIVFRIEKPRLCDVRIDGGTYQVHRPEEKKGERYVIEGQDLSGVLLEVFEPKVKELEKHCTVSATEDDGVVKVEIRPRKSEVTRHVTRLELHIRKASNELVAIHYTNAEDDEVRIKILDLEVNPSIDAVVFSKALPEGTKIKTHHVRDKKGKNGKEKRDG